MCTPSHPPLFDSSMYGANFSYLLSVCPPFFECLALFTGLLACQALARCSRCALSNQSRKSICAYLTWIQWKSDTYIHWEYDTYIESLKKFFVIVSIEWLRWMYVAAFHHFQKLLCSICSAWVDAGKAANELKWTDFINKLTFEQC